MKTSLFEGEDKISIGVKGIEYHGTWKNSASLDCSLSRCTKICLNSVEMQVLVDLN